MIAELPGRRSPPDPSNDLIAVKIEYDEKPLQKASTPNNPFRPLSFANCDAQPIPSSLKDAGFVDHGFMRQHGGGYKGNEIGGNPIAMISTNGHLCGKRQQNVAPTYPGYPWTLLVNNNERYLTETILEFLKDGPKNVFYPPMSMDTSDWRPYGLYEMLDNL